MASSVLQLKFEAKPRLYVQIKNDQCGNGTILSLGLTNPVK
jgi:hypothetical protein